MWDLLFEAGTPHGMLPFGQIALLMARIEAGLLLIHVDFDASRLAENDDHRSTPIELGLQWMLKGIDDDTRPFIGRKAILRERADGHVALEDDGADGRPVRLPRQVHERRHGATQGPPPVHEDMMVYDDAVQQRGLRHELHVLARAAASHRARTDCGQISPRLGQKVNLEFTINHRYVQVGADVARNPMFAPARKTAVWCQTPCSKGQPNEEYR